MKNKFQRMTKVEKKQAVKDFIAADPKNKNYMSTLNRMKILGIIGFIYGTVAILADIFILTVPVITYIVDATVMIFTAFLLVQRSRIYNGTMNAFVIQRDLSSKKTTKKDDKEEVEVPKKKVTKKATTKTTTKKTTTKKSTTKKASTKKAK